MKRKFNERYKTGDLPWNLGRPDSNLIRGIEQFHISPCHALDIGCGTGDNVFWLNQKGFNAAGVDISEKAIEIARDRKTEVNSKADFFVANILTDEIPETPYHFVFDRGCFHTFDTKKKRRKMARQIHSLLENGGHWLSLIGSYDDGRLDIGPPKRTAEEVIQSTEPWFEILLLEQRYFDSNHPEPSKMWFCFMRKRNLKK